MSENEGAPAPEFDPETASIHAIVEASGNESETDDATEDTEGGAEEDTSGNEENEADDSPADDSTDTPPTPEAGDDDDADNLKLPDLPSELSENEAFRKRWAEIEVGVSQAVTKAKSRLAEANLAKEQLEGVAQELMPYYEYKQRLEDPATAREAFLQLANAVERMTGINPLAEDGSYESGDDFDDWRNAGFSRQDYMDAKAHGIAYPSEYRAYKLAEERFAANPVFKEFQEQKKAAEERAKRDTLIDGIAPAVIGYFGKTDEFPVTKEMVRKAIEEFPIEAGDVQAAIRAVKRTYPDEYAKHHAQRAAKTYGKKRAPEMPESATARGVSVKDIDPETATIEELMQL